MLLDPKQINKPNQDDEMQIRSPSSMVEPINQNNGIEHR
jgi:hypothetical protein